ncbi:MAG: precorrin-3B C(17)-methyltransferase [Deltaproteobacteria bacterium]|nr:precorrin-3B C(17)-methyltransferase [Deltaproteobacteria bacterium]
MRSSSHQAGGSRTPAGPQGPEPERHPGGGFGKLFIVSLGPGDPQYLAPAARAALEAARVIVGYKTYIDLLDPALLKGKETLSTGMTGEIKRCRAAAASCSEGRDTAIVSSGDAGIYGMAGLALEILEEEGLTGKVDVEVVPGIPALAAAAALLGAPLMHDFAVVSLSDLLTPWNAIQRRIEAAASADFVLVIYNPRSRKRHWQLEEAVRLMRARRSARTPVGLVRSAARDGQSVVITTLADLPVDRVDMLSILVIGNSSTRVLGGRMVTPRGYLAKYGQTASEESRSGFRTDAHSD